MRNETEVRAQPIHFGNRVELLIGQKLESGKFSRGDVTFTEVDAGEFLMPSLSLRIPEAQLLMDELWRCGLRPTEGKGSAGSLAATEYHLADLRTLLFHSIGLDEKKDHR